MPQVRAKKPTNLSIDQELLTEARALKVNLSSAAEAGLRRAAATANAEAWKCENAGALEDYNLWIAENGLPLEKYRMF